jgi:hypothetical protein
MKSAITFILLLLAAATGTQALDLTSDATISAPYLRTDKVRIQGSLTLAVPGTYSALDWDIQGSVRFSAPGVYTLEAKDGGIRIAGNILGPGTTRVTVTMNYTTALLYRGLTAPTVTVIDGPISPPPPQTGVASSAPLVNISTRATLIPGAMLNPGFVIGGTAPRRVLLRAIGPGLAAFAIPNAALAPTLRVYSGPDEIAENSGWGGDVSLATVMAGVGAFSLDAGSKDAVLLLTLAPGSYTATVTATGEVLFELYFVD